MLMNVVPLNSIYNGFIKPSLGVALTVLIIKYRHLKAQPSRIVLYLKKTFLSASPEAKDLFTRYVVVVYGIVIKYSKYNNVIMNFLENHMWESH